MADNLDPDVMRQLNEQMANMDQTVRTMVPAMVLMTAALNENIKSQKGASVSQKDGKKIVDDFLKAQQQATAATEAATKAKQKEAEWQANWEMARKQATDGLKQFGNGLLTVGGGMAKYNTALGSAGDMAMSIGKNFGILGTAIGGFIKIFSVAAEMVLKQNDNILKATDSLAEFGATGQFTADEIKLMGRAAGYSTGELEKWTKSTKSIGSSMIAFGGTVNRGVESFAKLTQMTDKEYEVFRALGVSQEQLTQNQADYVKLQIRSGTSIKDSEVQNGKLRKATLEYTNYLLDLSAITGLTVDEAKKAQQVARDDLAVQTRLALMDDKIIELRAKGLNQDADRIEAEKKRTEALLDMAGTFLKGDELAGIQSTIATGNWNDISKGFASGYPELLDFIDSVKKGKREPYELGLELAKATKRTRENVGEAIIQNKEIGKAFAYSKEALENEAKYRGKSPEEIKKIIEEERERRKKGVQDGVQDARNAQESTERRMRIAADGLVDIVKGPVTSAFKMLMDVVRGFAKGLAHYSDKLFGTKLEQLFETPDDIKKDVEGMANDLDKLRSQLKEETDLRQNYLAKTEEYNKKDKEVQEARLAYAEMRKKGVGGDEAIAAQNRVKELEKERSALSTEKYNMGRELERRGGGSAANLEKKVAELEEKRNARLSQLAQKESEFGTNLGTKATSTERVSSAGGGRGGGYGVTAKPGEGVDVAGVNMTEYLKKIAMVESGGRADAKAKTSSASGLFQFTEGSWNDTVKAMGKNYSLQDRFDPKKSAEVAAFFTRRQQSQLEKGTGQIASEADLYMAHFLGAGGATKFINALRANPDAPASSGASPDQVKANANIFYDKQGNMRSLQQVYDLMSNKVASAGQQVASGKVSQDVQQIDVPTANGGGRFSGPDSGYLVMLHGDETVVKSNQGTGTITKEPLNDGSGESLSESFALFSEKLDEVISILSTSYDVQNDLLKYSRV